MRTLLLCLFLSCIGGARAATISIACDYSAITNALLTTAQEGDTVLIGPGEAVITSQIYVNRGISFTIAGSGTNSTTLRMASSATTGLQIASSSSNVFTIRDLNLVCYSGTAFWLYIGSTAASFPGPYHIYNIKMTNVMGRGISMGAGNTRNSYGVLHSSTFIAAPANFLQCVDFSGSGYAAWALPNPMGTTNVSCVEDCYFEMSADGNGVFDSYVGAQVLFRHNLVNGYAPISGHGYDSQETSIRTWEIYSNVFSNQDNTAMSQWRGGSGVMLSNAYWGTSPSMIFGVPYYRAGPETFPNEYAPSGYLGWGVPGRTYTINFAGVTNFAPGEGYMFTNGQPTNTAQLTLGATSYYFVSYLTNATYNMYNRNGNGGGAVLIGPTLADTITNLYWAVNANQTYYGVRFTNWSGLPFNIGHEFIATGLDSTNLYLRNALDSTNAYGYPANQQHGVVRSYPLTGTNFIQTPTVWPAWFGSNTYNGAIVDSVVPTYAGSNPNTNLIVMGRDFTNGIPPLAVYTPLTYPHPLRITLASSSRISATLNRVELRGGVIIR